jgi:hypothetical protein
MDVNRLAIIAQVLIVILTLVVLAVSEINGGIVVPGWGGV